MPVFETLGKVNRYRKFFLKRLPNWPGCAEASMQGLERAQPDVICTLFGDHHEYLNVRWFHSYYFKECTYFPMKTFIQIFSLLFVKICGKAAAQLPYGWTATVTCSGYWCSGAHLYSLPTGSVLPFGPPKLQSSCKGEVECSLAHSDSYSLGILWAPHRFVSNG